MNKEEIQFMLSAGFSIAEIMDMTKEGTAVTPAHVTQNESSLQLHDASVNGPDAQPVTPSPAEPVSAPADSLNSPVSSQPEAASGSDFAETFNEMMNDMRNVFQQQLGAIQAANIRNAVQTEEQQKTPEDLIANIIHPTMKERKERTNVS